MTLRQTDLNLNCHRKIAKYDAQFICICTHKLCFALLYNISTNAQGAGLGAFTPTR
jgi:hypothetical protein